jgi:hypothetical protein
MVATSLTLKCWPGAAVAGDGGGAGSQIRGVSEGGGGGSQIMGVGTDVLVMVGVIVAVVVGGGGVAGGGGGSQIMGVVAGGGAGSHTAGPTRQLALAPPKTTTMVRITFCKSSGSLFQGTMVSSLEIGLRGCLKIGWHIVLSWYRVHSYRNIGMTSRIAEVISWQKNLCSHSQRQKPSWQTLCQRLYR